MAEQQTPHYELKDWVLAFLIKPESTVTKEAINYIEVVGKVLQEVDYQLEGNTTMLDKADQLYAHILEELQYQPKEIYQKLAALLLAELIRHRNKFK